VLPIEIVSIIACESSGLAREAASASPRIQMPMVRVVGFYARDTWAQRGHSSLINGRRVSSNKIDMPEYPPVQ
jgi:hypothetical protein